MLFYHFFARFDFRLGLLSGFDVPYSARRVPVFVTCAMIYQVLHNTYGYEVLALGKDLVYTMVQDVYSTRSASRAGPPVNIGPSGRRDAPTGGCESTLYTTRRLP